MSTNPFRKPKAPGHDAFNPFLRDAFLQGNSLPEQANLARASTLPVKYENIFEKSPQQGFSQAVAIGLIGDTSNQYVNASNGINTSPFSAVTYSNTNGASSISNPFVFKSEISTDANQGHEIFGDGSVTSGDIYALARPAKMPSVSLSSPMAFAPAMQQPQAYTPSMSVPQPQQSLGEVENPYMDVASFKRPLTTSSENSLNPDGSNTNLISRDWTQSAPGDSRSNLDASFASKPPVFEPLREDRLEKPRTPNERIVPEGEDELGLLHTVVRAERNPQAFVPSARKYDKSIPAGIPRDGSVPDSPASLHSSRNNSIKPDHPSIGNVSEEQRRPSDLNKPLPLPPDLVNLDGPEERIVFNERVFGGPTDGKKVLSLPVKTVPHLPQGYRSGSLKSSVDKPVGELYKSLRGCKPSDELFSNLSPHTGMETTPGAPSTPPNHNSSNSGPENLTSSLCTMHIVDQYSSARNHESPTHENPFNISSSSEEISSHSLKFSPSLSSLSPSGRNARQLQSSPVRTTVYTPFSPVSTSISVMASPSTAATSTAHSPEIGIATPPITPATMFPIPVASSSIRTAKPPPVPPPPRRSSGSRKNSEIEAHLTLVQAKRTGTDPIPQIPQFQVPEYRSLSESSRLPLTPLANMQL